MGTGAGSAAHPGASPSKGEQTREAILRAAVARFGRDGYRSTSVADIARDASVGGTVAYAYFTNKEALFLAAIDRDAAAAIHDGLAGVLDTPGGPDWRQLLFVSLVGALDDHPLARRLLAGLEPDVTDRVLELPALADLRAASAERLRADQRLGTVRPDVDPDTMAEGFVAIVISLLMSVVQFGEGAAARFADGIVAVFEAAVATPPGSIVRPVEPYLSG